MRHSTCAGQRGHDSTDGRVGDDCGPASGQTASLVARYQSNGSMYYAGVHNTGTGFFAEIWKIVAGVPTKLKSASLARRSVVGRLLSR